MPFPWAPVAGLVIGLIVIVFVERIIVRHQSKLHATILTLDSGAVFLVFTSYVVSEVFKISDALRGSPFEVGFHDVAILLSALGGSVVIYVAAKRF